METSDRDYVPALFDDLRHSLDQMTIERGILLNNVRGEIDYKITSLEKQVDRRFISAEQAVLRANETLAHRLESMNEVRDQLREQAGTFARRDYIDAKVDVMEQEINDLKSSKASSDAVDSYRRWLGGIAIATGATALGLIIELLKNWPR
jgi:hypothetical protein